MALKYATTLKNNRLDEITSYAGNGAILKLLDGNRPASPTGAGGEETTVIATFTCGTPFAGAASAGVITLSNIATVAAAATAIATWFRVYQSDGTTWVMDGSVGVLDSGADLELDNTSIVATEDVQMTDGQSTITAGN